LALALATLLPPGDAGARAVYNPQGAPQPAPHRSFWERVKSPHGDDVQRLVAEATTLRFQYAQQQYYDWHMAPVRHQVLRDALERYLDAYALDPTRVDLLLEAAHTAFEAAAWPDAQRLYLLWQDKADNKDDVTVHFNLAEAELRQGLYDEAASELEDGLAGPVIGLDRARYLDLLGYVYMAQHRLDDAAEVVERADEVFQQAYGGGSDDVFSLALLAVIYDRDDQQERAHDAIDGLRAVDPSFVSVLGQSYAVMGSVPPSQRYYVPFAPAADRHYFLALFYEAMGRDPEAIASWRAYLDSADPAYTQRAKDHLAAAEKRRDQALDAAKKQKKTKPPAVAGPRQAPQQPQPQAVP
jgi:tetratricopeptide (TPR) repeat protein